MDIHPQEHSADSDPKTTDSGVTATQEPGVQEAPQPVRIERADLMEYLLLGVKAEKAQLLIDMYSRELQRAQIDFGQISQEARKFMLQLESKYGVNLQQNMITEDGVVIPRNPARDPLMRKQQ
jgi:hypothetical protein